LTNHTTIIVTNSAMAIALPARFRAIKPRVCAK
jgi:hypothetical protein